MPYVKADLREHLEFINPLPSNPGELNYAISLLVHRYVTAKGISYAVLNEAMGVLSCVQAEFYRTVAAPYENGKARENGPVSDLDKPFFSETGIPVTAPVETSGSKIDIATLTASIVAAMRAAERPAAAPVAARKAKRPTTGPFPPPPAEPAQEAPLARGQAKVLQGPIPGDTPGAASTGTPPRVTRPAQERLPPPGKDASAGEKALYELAEGDDL